jgi:hypothetical protein
MDRRESGKEGKGFYSAEEVPDQFCAGGELVHPATSGSVTRKSASISVQWTIAYRSFSAIT